MLKILFASLLLISSLGYARTNVEKADYGTQRQGMHACPAGSYMTGAHLAQNVFLCATFTHSTYKLAYEKVDAGTQQLGMHVCPKGTVMTGFHAGRNLLLCAPFAEGGGRRFVDTSTQRNGVHACALDMPMAGIHVGNNAFACEY